MTKQTKHAAQIAASALLDAARAATRTGPPAERGKVEQHIATVEAHERRNRHAKRGSPEQEASNAVVQLQVRESLAAVCLHVLITEKADGLEAISKAVERNPGEPTDRDEVEMALGLLEVYGVADRTPERSWSATLPARMTLTRLSF
jgi:hypothetical protein